MCPVLEPCLELERVTGARATPDIGGALTLRFPCHGPTIGFLLTCHLLPAASEAIEIILGGQETARVDENRRWSTPRAFGSGSGGGRRQKAPCCLTSAMETDGLRSSHGRRRSRSAATRSLVATLNTLKDAVEAGELDPVLITAREERVGKFRRTRS